MDDVDIYTPGGAPVDRRHYRGAGHETNDASRVTTYRINRQRTPGFTPQFAVITGRSPGILCKIILEVNIRLEATAKDDE